MRMDPRFTRVFPWLATALAAAVGLALLTDCAWKNSATYDEALYLKVAAHWWRTGDDLEITRVGSPLLFWKIQQAPTLWLFDRIGFGVWIDRPLVYQARSLPWLRLGSLWIWLVGWGATAAWARWAVGAKGMVFAAWWFALSPNLLAHGSLLTMETPLIASSSVAFALFWEFLKTGGRRWFWAGAAACGLAFSCKFTAIVFPIILGAVWLVVEINKNMRFRAVRNVLIGMTFFTLTMFLADWVLTGFATAPISPNRGEHHSLDRGMPASWRTIASRALETPIPRDLAGFATQVRLQGRGGTSYLMGRRSEKGWWYYYFAALAVKTPLSLWMIVLARSFRRGDSDARERERGMESLIPVVIGVFLAIAAAGSSRNFGVRYLLPLAPLTIVWGSRIVEGNIWMRRVAWIALLGQAVAVYGCHPNELSYFNMIAGGPKGGRLILSDSNLDWGQGCRALARLQREKPELRDLTFFYFGDVDPAVYGVQGRNYVIRADSRPSDLPPKFAATTRFVAVSASLRFGPWGPPGYFRELDGWKRIAEVAGWGIEVFERADNETSQINPKRKQGNDLTLSLALRIESPAAAGGITESRRGAAIRDRSGTYGKSLVWRILDRRSSVRSPRDPLGRGRGSRDRRRESRRGRRDD